MVVGVIVTSGQLEHPTDVEHGVDRRLQHMIIIQNPSSVVEHRFPERLQGNRSEGLVDRRAGEGHAVLDDIGQVRGKIRIVGLAGVVDAAGDDPVVPGVAVVQLVRRRDRHRCGLFAR